MFELRPTGTESVVAVMPPRNENFTLSKEISGVELQAESITIECDTDYAEASTFARKLKEFESRIVAFWKPKKESAYSTHKQVCEGEKEMLKPVQRALATVKQNMATFTAMQEAKRQAIEKEARLLAAREAELKLAVAIAAEEKGDKSEVASTFLDAQMADALSRTMTVDMPKPRADGVSHRKDWVIESIDQTQVPVSFNGAELRPVDEKAVIRLIRASKGKIQIPGICYKETISTTVRK